MTASLDGVEMLERARAARSVIAAEQPPVRDREELLAVALWPRPLIGEGLPLLDDRSPGCAAQSAARRGNRRRW